MHGFVYSITSGTYRSINDPNGIGTTTVNGINDSGQLVGFYVDANGNTDGFVATPTSTPEPGSVILLSTGLGLLGFLRKIRKRAA